MLKSIGLRKILRQLYGDSQVGDATGYFHPITASGMTIGFMDVECLIRSKSFENYQCQRKFQTYVPEMLAMTLHELFRRDDESAVAIRRAIYQMWPTRTP